MPIHRAVIGLLLIAAEASPTTTLNTFSYSVPPQVASYPALRAWFSGEEKRLRLAAEAEAVAGRNDAVSAGIAYHPYETDRAWKVVADLPGFLSLSETRYDYTGGAHGETSYASLVWDKTAQVRRPTISFFLSPAVLDGAVATRFCEKLNARRDTPGVAEYGPCPKPVREVLILGSTNRRRFDRIGFLVAPYDARPFAQGSFDITLPVTPAVLAAVKPEFRGYFELGTP